eukprot:scaffold50388_cov33-Tisochrysis_lutea.AAC.3
MGGSSHKSKGGSGIALERGLVPPLRSEPSIDPQPNTSAHLELQPQVRKAEHESTRRATHERLTRWWSGVGRLRGTRRSRTENEKAYDVESTGIYQCGRQRMRP